MSGTPSTVRTNSRVIRWIDHRLPIFTFTQDAMVDYPEPRNLNYWWNFGSLAGIMLVIMIVTGIFLAMYYTPNAGLAFDSVERLMRDVNYGWLIRYIHMNGASFFFIVVYIHISRGLFYGSYKEPRELLWMLGVVIFLLMIATAFFGYVLPWGQIITNLFTAIPVIGNPIHTWLLGGFAVGNSTLNRFYSLHYLLPFVIVGVVGLHLIALRQHGSSNPLGIAVKGPQDQLPFHPYYTVKDMFGLCVFLIIFAVFVFEMPNLLGDPQNYLPANPLQTPPEITPEWYLLPFYAILRSIPQKLVGVLAMFGSILILFIVPWLDTSRIRSAVFRPIYKWVFWLLIIDVFVLGTVGAHRPEGTWIVIGRLATLYYFAHFIILMPLIGWFERPLPLPESIAAAVTRKRPEGATPAPGRAVS
jgi:ubiquinol-cytochrome c reductase cytochrome b subunit